MRHVPLKKLMSEAFTDGAGQNAQERLARAKAKVAKMQAQLRQGHIRRNGPNKWSPIKERFVDMLGNKCWYTEAEVIGGNVSVDHYRPICEYWWLAYDVENYRLACAYANSPQHNPQYGCAGGKGDNFPLLAPAQRAQSSAELETETPVILDPCNQEDCDLLAFQADGRPVLNPEKADVQAKQRVDESLILLNIDHPHFNSKREQLCRDIADDVRTYEELPNGAAMKAVIRERLAGRLAPSAPFSTAARYYLRLHRHRDWVEEVLVAT